MLYNGIKILLAVTAITICTIDFSDGSTIGSFATQDLNGDSSNSNSFPKPAPMIRSRRHSRFRRKDDPFATAVEHVQMIARLTSAIYLQDRLVNGSIDSEQLISELLRFGSVTPAQIHAINKDTVKDALTKLKDVPSKLKDSSKLGSFFAAVDKVLKDLDGIAKITTWAEKDTFEKDMKALESGQVDFSNVTSLKSDAGDWETFSKIRKLSDSTALTIFNINDLIRLGVASTKILKAGTEYAKNLPKLFQFETKSGAVEGVSHWTKMVKGMKTIKKLRDDLAIDVDEFQTLSDNYDKINASITAVQQIKGSLEIISKMLVSRTRKSMNPHHLKYTIGLPAGFNDINTLTTHFDNEWFLSIVKDKRLSDAFTPLRSQSLASSVTSLSDALRRKPEEQTSKTIIEILDSVDKLSRIISNLSIGDAKNIQTCFELTPNIDVNSDKIGELHESAAKIDKEFERLAGLSKTLNDVKGRKSLEELVKICEMAVEKDDKTWKPAFAKFFEYAKSSKLTEAEQFIINIKKAVGDDTTLKTEASTALGLFPEIDTFQNKAVAYVKIFNCTLAQKDTDKSIQFMKETEELRRQAADHEKLVNEAVNVANTVVGTQKDMLALAQSIENIKGFSSFEADLLKVPNAEEISKVVGLSSRGAMSMEAVIKLQNLDVFAKHAKLVEDQAIKHLKDLTQDQPAALKTFSSIPTFLDRLRPKLATWKTEVTSMNLTNLTDFTVMFNKANDTPGLTLDLGKISEAIGTLVKLQAPNSKELSSLKDVHRALDDLNSIGMDFGSYDKYYDKYEKSAQDLDLFFANFQQTISRTTTAPIFSDRDGNLPQHRLRPDDRTEAPEWDKIFNNQNYLIAGLGFLLICAVIGFWLYQRKQAAKNRPEKVVEKPFTKVITSRKAAIGYIKGFHFKLNKFAKQYKMPNPDEFLLANVKIDEAAAKIKERKKGGKDGAAEKQVGKGAGSSGQKSAIQGGGVKGAAAQKSSVQKVPALQGNTLTGPEEDPDTPGYVRVVPILHVPSPIKIQPLPDLEKLKREQRAKLFYDFCRLTHFAVDGDQKEVVSKLVQKHYHEQRYAIQLANQTRITFSTNKKDPIHFDTDYFHGNRVFLDNGLKTYLVQAPIVNLDGTIPTVKKFYHLIKTDKIKSVTMLCNFEENNFTRGKDHSEVKACKYFPTEKGETLKFKGLQVKCINVKQEGNTFTRQLEITFDGDKEPYTITHYQHIGWPDHSAPEDPTEIVKLLMEVRNLQSVLIHCSAGIGRSGSFDYMEIIYQAIASSEEESGFVDYGELLRWLRKNRAKAIQEPIQFAFSLICVVEMLFHGVDPKTIDKDILEWRENLLLAYQDALQMFKEEAIKKYQEGEAAKKKAKK